MRQLLYKKFFCHSRRNLSISNIYIESVLWYDYRVNSTLLFSEGRLLKPLVSINGDIIFSPITMDHLKKDWLNGIMDFILPYEVGMNKTKQLILEWKNSYEKQIVYDMYRQQNRFFNEHKEDEKFQRRIDYLRENADQVIRQLGCTEYTDYKVIPYMCMNKVLVSRYKNVAFPIVEYPELVEIISGDTRE